MQNDNQNFDSNPTDIDSQALPHSRNRITSKSMMLVGIIGLSLLFAIGGYLIGSKESTTQQTQIQTEQNIIPLETVSPETTTNDRSAAKDTTSTNIPVEWTYKSNGECDVSFPIPPKSEPYYFPPNSNIERSVTKDVGSGRYWDFPRGNVSRDMLTLLSGNNQNSMQANAMFASDDEVGGYVSAVISVSCINNALKLDNQTLLKKLEDGIQKYNQDTNDKGMGPNKYTIVTISDTEKWGRPVLDLTVNKYFLNSGGQPFTQKRKYTVFADSKYIYEASIIGESADLSVLETAEMIFSNLLFK